jgi:hypothetical protein
LWRKVVSWPKTGEAVIQCHSLTLDYQNFWNNNIEEDILFRY